KRTGNDGTLQDNWLVREIDHFLGEARAGESKRPVDVVFGPGSMESPYPGRLKEKARWDWIDLRRFSIWRAHIPFSYKLDDGVVKLGAAFYDVPERLIPELRREERRRRHRIIGFAVAVLCVFAAITTALAIWALINLRDADLAQAKTLRGTLEPERRS